MTDFYVNPIIRVFFRWVLPYLFMLMLISFFAFPGLRPSVLGFFVVSPGLPYAFVLCVYSIIRLVYLGAKQQLTKKQVFQYGSYLAVNGVYMLLFIWDDWIPVVEGLSVQ